MTNIKEKFGTGNTGNTGTTGDYNWSVNSDGTLTITKYNQPPQPTTIATTTITATGTTIAANNNLIILNIPTTLDNKTVAILGPNSFQNTNNFDTVHIPSSVLNIGNSAFMGCVNLKYLGFNSDTKLTTIAQDAFNGTSIRHPKIPATVLSIGDGAFNTTNLYSVTFLGNCPVFTKNAFVVRVPNIYPPSADADVKIRTNLNRLSPDTNVVVYYFNDKKGFDKLDQNYFITVSVQEMFIPLPPTRHNPIWVIILIVMVIVLLLYGAAKLI